MTGDARFEDADEHPLYLGAADADDLGVISALVQDAVLTAADMRWEGGKRRFVLLVNRFRWEHAGPGSAPERVRSILIVGGVGAVSSMGITKGDADTVLSLLSVDWEPGADADGRLVLTFAGDGAIACSAECLDVSLKDVTRPYRAPSGHRPSHPE